MARAAKTELFVRKQSGGMFTVVNEGVSTGNIFWVDSGSSTGADAVGYGANPDKPFLQIDFAIGQCTASNGDRIYAMPGHVETIATAGALDLDTIGITAIGIGEGPTQPIIDLTDAASDVDVDASGIIMRNFNFRASDDDVLVCLDVNAVDFWVLDSRFTGASATKNFHVCVQDGTANQSDGLHIERCEALQPDAANTHFFNISAAQDRMVIRDNVLMGDWGTMAIGGAGVPTYIFIHNNIIYNAATTDDACINLPANATGMITRNLVGADATSGQANHITAPDVGICENYASLTAAEELSGIIEPASTA